MKSDMYSRHAQQYDAVIRNNIYNAYFERPSLQALLDDIKGLDILDLGCGTGVYAQYFIDQGTTNITCLDFSKEMVTLVNDKFSTRVKSYVQDLSNGLPNEKDASADVIVCPLVIHYLADLAPLFKAVSRVLKPNGYMVFSTHHPFADFDCTLTGNYFQQEYVTQQWDTIGEPVNVSFYRRSLTEISDAITTNGLVISRMSEGKVLEEAKQICSETYEYLLKNPNFIFIRCQIA